MCPISNESGSDTVLPSPWEDGDTSSSSSRKLQYKDLIKKANAVDIIEVFSFYRIKISESNRKIVCPFPHHKGGKETTPSFLYYPQTNTFWCFGCNTGSSGTDFVSIMDACSKVKAANKIIDLYGKSLLDEDIDTTSIDFNEKMNVMIEFSDFIRNKIIENNCDNDFLLFIEKNTASFDKMNEKYMLDVSAINLIINNIKKRIEDYKCQH